MNMFMNSVQVSFLAITRRPELGFGRDLGEIELQDVLHLLLDVLGVVLVVLE